jgi:pimeloyl-ACP methyl ester carboxylesterase
MTRFAWSEHDELDRCAEIHPTERDYALHLHAPTWGKHLRPEWDPIEQPARHFKRVFQVHGDEPEADRRIEERIVPFPSAPIYGINRQRDYGFTLERPNLHTVRVIRRADDGPITRLFILHNGLNEASNLRLYYRLADWIFSEHAAPDSEGTPACVVVPFAGHLMHAPFHGPFSQTPLSRYLGDSGELFRQFLRYMVQMRWLLSAITRLDDPWRVGWDILRGSRSKSLSAKLAADWTALADASETLLRRLTDEEPDGNVEPTDEPDADDEPEQADDRETRDASDDANGEQKPSSRADLVGPEVDEATVGSTIAVLRTALGIPADADATPLDIHVVGYSLGGFLAQSVFFAWPQLVSSCTTICSGGAIRAISPTAFAHAEEWQAVLHSLRAELEDAMLGGRLTRDRKTKTVAGMPAPRFGYFKRVFDQVFLQEDQGSYRQRLSEYSARMLFMSGGEDPIVKPQEVLDASPREGITMLSIANLTHFLGVAPRKDRHQERSQREFWLPEVGRLIARAAMRAEELADDELRTAIEARKARPPRSTRTKAEKRRPRASDLSSTEFDEALDWVLDAVTEDEGWLIVVRNTLPAALLAPRRFADWGSALHHHDAQVQVHAKALRIRAAALRKRRERVTLLVPDKLMQWFVNGSALFDPQSDTPHGRFMERADRQRLWTDFECRWRECMRELHPERIDHPLPERLDKEDELVDALTAWQDVEREHLKITHLPNVWISLDSSMPPAGVRRRRQFEDRFVTWVAQLVSELQPGRTDPREDVGKNSAVRRLGTQLRDGSVRIVQVSDAELDPRYRGRIESSPGAAIRVLAQCAAGMLRSTPRSDPSAVQAAAD